MIHEITGTRGKFDMKLRNCNNRMIPFATMLYRFESTSSKHAKQEVAVRYLSTVLTCLKMKE